MSPRPRGTEPLDVEPPVGLPTWMLDVLPFRFPVPSRLRLPVAQTPEAGTTKNAISPGETEIYRADTETRLPAEALQAAVDALPDIFQQFGPCIFIRHYIRQQFGTGEKLIRNHFFIGLKSLFTAIKDPALRQSILAEYPEFERALPRASEGLSKPQDKSGSGNEW